MRSLTLLILVLACGSLRAAVPTSPLVSVRSNSRQFVVYGIPLKQKPLLDQRSRVRLDPSLLAVSCERIKQALLGELGLPDRWRGKVLVVSQFTTVTNRPIDIQSTCYREGWQYRMDLADEVEPSKLIRAVVHVLLLELANRQAGTHSAEIPLWLTEGLTGHLSAVSSVDLVLRMEMVLKAKAAVEHTPRIAQPEYRREALRTARAQLRDHEACTFNEMSLPTAGTLSGERWDIYKVSSHLLVAELLKLPDGRQRLQLFLQLLPQYLNWQIAFLQAYQPYFGSLLDVEKWWALRLAQIEGEDLWFGWSKPAVWNQWEAILRVNVMVSEMDARLPSYSSVPLQRMIELYDYAAQKEVLVTKLGQLAFLRQQASPKVKPAIDSYIQTLKDYMSRREAAGYEPAMKGLPTPRPQVLVEETVRRLDALDQRREAMRRLWVGGPAPPAGKRQEAARRSRTSSP